MAKLIITLSLIESAPELFPLLNEYFDSIEEAEPESSCWRIYNVKKEGIPDDDTQIMLRFKRDSKGVAQIEGWEAI